VTGYSAANHIIGGAGNDTLLGMEGKDTLDGGTGNDLLSGGAGADRLNGNAGNDTLVGDSGSDALNGGAGDDLLSGGLGRDYFIFRAGDGHDKITDFTAEGTGQDLILATHELINHFEKHLVLDVVTNAVLGVEVDFFNAGHVAQGSIFLQNVLNTDLITAADFFPG
jgi:Ca2+-binding RTX toxin-like protein